YPNPAIDYLNIKLKNSQLKDVQFEIYNIIGNKLKFELDVVNSDTYKINVKEFHSGYYLLIIKDPISRYNKAFKFRK
ncbi:MAG: T9SS type A sorting domain-containing protein, partial [Cyclobacteriaceae bacterium]|nr:T9SS type A sorting domain-containing protein [Cyclobacteriaceae bacterium]